MRFSLWSPLKFSSYLRKSKLCRLARNQLPSFAAYKTKWLERLYLYFLPDLEFKDSVNWSFACWLLPCCPQSESLWISVLSTKIYCIYFSSIHLEPQVYELVQRREQLTVSQEPKSLSFIPLVSASLTKWSKERKKEESPIHLRFTQWNLNLFKNLRVMNSLTHHYL